MSFLIDSHCHLDFPQLHEQLDEVLERARQQNVKRFIVPGVTAADWDRVCALPAQHQGIQVALGLHPCFIDAHQTEHLDQLEARLHNTKVIAVGEIGLDLWHGRSQLDQQRQLLQAQLELAKRYQLPVILHVRKAHDEVLALLRRYRLEQAGVVHAFSGSQQQAEHYIKLGFKLGFGGTLSYSRAAKLRRLAASLPLSSMVLETDAPDMSLLGRADRPNEPRYVANVAAIIAELRGIDIDEVARQTSLNVQALFGPAIMELT